MSTDPDSDRPCSETLYLEFSDDKSHKFYEVTVLGTSVTIRYGRIGSSGQSSSTTYATAEKAQSEATQKINEKLRKGYVQVASEGDASTPDDLLNPEPVSAALEGSISTRTIDYAALPVESIGDRTVVSLPLRQALAALEIVATCEYATFTINLDIATDVAYHFDVRFSQRKIVQNTQVAGIWGAEEHLAIPPDFASGQPFTLKITVEEMIVVSVNGQPLTRYAHRLPPTQINSVHLVYPPANLQVQSVQVFERLDTAIAVPTDAQTTQGTVALAPTTTAEYTGTRWEVHATVKPETETVNRAINTEVVQSPQPELPLPSITLLNVSPFAPPRVAKEHLRQIDYPSAFSFREYLDCSMAIPLPRSLVALEMVGTFNNLAASSFTLTLQAQNNIAYMLLFRPNEGYLIQHTGGDGENAGEQRVKIPASLASGQVFQLVVAITGKRDFVLYLNNQPFHYTPRYRPDKPIDQVSLNYDTSGLRLQLFRGLEPRGARPSGMSQKPAIAVPDSQPKESPTLSQEQNMIAVPEFLRELPSQFEPFRPFLEANLVPYIKVQATEVQNQSIANVGSSWCHDPLELWQSKIGGHPYLPKGMSYPADRQTGQLMMFLMQINCADLPVISSLNLPKQGILQFYIGLDVAMCELSPEQHRVLYFPEVSHSTNDLITDFSFLEEPAIALEWYENVYTLNFSSQQDVFWNARRQMDDAFEIPEALTELYEDFNEWISDYEDRCSLRAQSQGGRENKLGGHPELHSDVEETIEGARGRLLLELQHEFNSDDNFYFFIEEIDLASQNFNSIESYFLRN